MTREIKKLDIESIKEIIKKAPEDTETYIGNGEYIDMLDGYTTIHNLDDLRTIDRLFDSIVEYTLSRNPSVMLKTIIDAPTTEYQSSMMGFPGESIELTASQFKSSLIEKLTTVNKTISLGRDD